MRHSYGQTRQNIDLVEKTVVAIRCDARRLFKGIVMANSDSPSSGCNTSCDAPAQSLNRDCYCTTLNRQQLIKSLQADALNQDILATHPQLFSNTTVFISPSQWQQMQAIIQAVSRVVKLPSYRQQVLARDSSATITTLKTAGVFMGYDFHLSAQGPKIIEINTNAGGAFLNATLVGAQTECCHAAGTLLPQLKTALDEEFMTMFLREWQLQRGNTPLNCIAIVDENPTQQFLYPEFQMAQRMFERNGITAIIADPSELQLTNGAVYFQHKDQQQKIDLIYNRLTDFSFAASQHDHLRQAYEKDSVVITPNPQHYALFADKRNLIVLGDPTQLTALGVEPNDIAVLQAGIPLTEQVSANNAVQLWSARKQLFFKPAIGFGSRATYRGDKLTKRVWDEILQGNYVAQHLVVPSERGLLVDGHETALKMDIRAYVYDAEIQLLAARLYQGQTTNFRTQGGGFAPVFVVE
jgi:hypothetical protein